MVSEVTARMRVKHGERTRYKRHPVFEGTQHVGWLAGKIDEDTEFNFMDPLTDDRGRDIAPKCADFIDADGNVIDRAQVIADWNARKAAEKEPAAAAAGSTKKSTKGSPKEAPVPAGASAGDPDTPPD